MNGNSDFDRLAQSWLQDGPAELPDRSLQAALDEVHVTSQWRFGAARRTFTMNGNTPRLAVAAVIGLLVLVVGGIYLGNNGGSGGVGGQPAASPSPTIAPTASPEPTPARIPGSGPIEAGTYLMTDGLTSFSITIPAGWDATFDGRDLRKHRDQPNEVTFGIYSPDIRVYADACATEDAPPPTGPTADDLIAALRAQENSDVSEAAEVIVGDSPAMRLDVSTPEGLDVARCYDGIVRIWVDDAGGYLAGLGDDWTSSVTIVEASSGRVVIYGGNEPDATAPDRAELQAIIDSIQFKPRTAP